MVQEELCLPAVNELRYAGRRLIDAWISVRRGDYAEATAKIKDAKFDCHRARHDSIDAISSKIAKDISITVDAFTVSVVVKAYPDYTKMMTLLFDIQKNIEDSRSDRTDREKIYKTIESCNIDQLIDYHRVFRLAEATMVALDAEDTKEKFYEKGGFWLALAALIIGAVFWYFPRA